MCGWCKGALLEEIKRGWFSPFWQRQHLMKGNSLNCQSRQVSVGLCLIPGPFIQPYCGLLSMFLLAANVIRLIVQLVAVCLEAKERLTYESQHRGLVLHKIIVLLKSKKKQPKTCKLYQELWWHWVI